MAIIALHPILGWWTKKCMRKDGIERVIVEFFAVAFLLTGFMTLLSVTVLAACKLVRTVYLGQNMH